MYDHIGLKVKDIDASVRFYSAALAALGYELCSHDAAGAGFGPAKAPALWLSIAKGSTGPGVHVAFRAADHAGVNRFHKDGLRPVAATTASRAYARTTAPPTTLHS